MVTQKGVMMMMLKWQFQMKTSRASVINVGRQGTTKPTVLRRNPKVTRMKSPRGSMAGVVHVEKRAKKRLIVGRRKRTGIMHLRYYKRNSRRKTKKNIQVLQMMK